MPSATAPRRHYEGLEKDLSSQQERERISFRIIDSEVCLAAPTSTKELRRLEHFKKGVVVNEAPARRVRLGKINQQRSIDSTSPSFCRFF